MGVHAFLNANLKVNVIAQIEFKLAYCNVAVQHINHFPMGLPTFVIL